MPANVTLTFASRLFLLVAECIFPHLKKKKEKKRFIYVLSKFKSEGGQRENLMQDSPLSTEPDAGLRLKRERESQGQDF